MIVVTDATALILLVNPGANPPEDPATGQPVPHARERIEKLITDIERDRGTIVIPTPALAEALVRAEDAAPDILERLNRSARFKIADFDQRAAVEVSAMTREAIRAGDKFDGSTAPWQRVKLDRQIIAIARVNMATTIYSDDSRLASFGARSGLNVVRTWELPLPAAPQETLFTAAGVAEVEPDAATNKRRFLNLDD